MNLLLIAFVVVTTCFVFIRLLDAFKVLDFFKSLNEKTKEFLLFLIQYVVVFSFVVCIIYMSKLVDSRESWQLGIVPFLQVAFFCVFFYLPPTFLVAYLLYPFKTIKKKSKFSLWILLSLLALFLICCVLGVIGLAFSNM